MADWCSLTRIGLPGAGRERPGTGSDRPVARRDGRVIAHDEFARDVARWHVAFAQRPGERFAIYFDDAYAFACALFGAWHAGKVAVLPGDAQPATVERLLPQVEGCVGDLPGAFAAAAEPAGFELDPLDLRATRLVIYTSGSSGQPLAIHKRLAQLEAEIRHLEQLFGPRLKEAGQPVLHATVSHQHIYGLLFLTLWPLAAGRTLEVAKLVYPEQMAERLGAERSVLVSSPAHLKRLPETLDWSAARAHLCAVFSSGGPLPPESSQQAHALLDQSPIEVYGSSETGGVAWRQRALHGDAWNALPGVQWRLAEGTLCVQSAHLDGDDWWETSDRAEVLPDGRFVLRGRADRIVKIEEKRVSLVAMEDALLATRLVAEARALLLPDAAGARLAVVAVPSEAGWDALRSGGKRALNERLRAQLAPAFERIALPRRFRYVRELPVNSQGKATEVLLSAQFEPTVPAAEWSLREATRAALTVEVGPELRVFDGHFPGAPVLPGVVQLDWAIAWGGEAFKLPPRFLRAEQLKYQLPVLPPLRLDVTLEWQAEAGHLHFRIVSERGTHSSGRLQFGVEGV